MYIRKYIHIKSPMCIYTCMFELFWPATMVPNTCVLYVGWSQEARLMFESTCAYPMCEF